MAFYKVEPIRTDNYGRTGTKAVVFGDGISISDSSYTQDITAMFTMVRGSWSGTTAAFPYTGENLVKLKSKKTGLLYFFINFEDFSGGPTTGSYSIKLNDDTIFTSSYSNLTNYDRIINGAIYIKTNDVITVDGTIRGYIRTVELVY